MLGFSEPLRVAVIGANSGIAKQIIQTIVDDNAVTEIWISTRGAPELTHHKITHHFVDVEHEEQIKDWAREMKNAQFKPNLILNCLGILHTDSFGPEKTWRHLDYDAMRQVFAINAFAVPMLGKYLLPLISRQERVVFLSFSAKVGSIGDNRLGGWYSYRASKAAHNMFVKTLSIEAKMKYPQLCIAAYHPGTVDTKLSKPFTKRYPAEKLFSPARAVQEVCSVLSQLQPENSGNFFAWDGAELPF